MTRQRTLQEIRDLRYTVQQMLDTYQGRAHVRIGAVTHGPDDKVGLPRTACGIRWVPNIMIPPVFPQGVPTEDEVDCMTCLVLEGRS